MGPDEPITTDRRGVLALIAQAILALIFGGRTARLGPATRAAALRVAEEVADRVIFRGGRFKLTVAIKGFELTDEQMRLIADTDLAEQLGIESIEAPDRPKGPC